MTFFRLLCRFDTGERREEGGRVGWEESQAAVQL